MKKIALSFLFVLGIFSVSQAAVKKEKSSVKKKTTYLRKKTVAEPSVLVMTENCCDGTSRSTIVISWPTEPPEPVNIQIIHDPNGDCPLCPPE